MGRQRVAVDSLRPPVCGFLFRLVPHAVVRASDAVQPFLSRQFSGVLLLFGRQRGIVLGGFLFLVLFIHKPIL